MFRNLAVSMVRKVKFTFLKTMSSVLHTPKQFWTMYHSLTPNHKCILYTFSNDSITIESPTSKANLLYSFFASCLSTSTCRATLQLSYTLLQPSQAFKHQVYD